MQQSIVKFYYFVVQTLLNMFRVLLCPSSGARQTAVAASGFCMNVEAENTSTSTFIRKPEATTAVIELLMMCGKTPKTRSAVNKRQDNKLKNCCIRLMIYLN